MNYAIQQGLLLSCFNEMLMEMHHVKYATYFYNLQLQDYCWVP
jgi:hypothetical protein